MRITLHPGVDLDVTPGSRLGDLRPELARVTCRPELASAPLVIDGVPLGEDLRVGTRPLLPGAILRVAPGTAQVRAGRRTHAAGRAPAAGARNAAGRPPRAAQAASAPAVDPDVAALRAPWHVAILSGPGCGELLPLSPGSPVVLGGEAGPSVVVTAGPRRRRLTGARDRSVDPAPRVAVRVRRRTRPRTVDRGQRPPSPPVRWAPPDGRFRGVLRGTARPWRPGHVLRVGSTTFDLRPRPRLEEWGVASGLAAREGAGPHAGLGPSSIALAITPAVGSLALAASMRQPLFALLALVGPLTLVVPLLLARRRRRVSPGDVGPVDAHAGTEPGRGGGAHVRPRAQDGSEAALRTSSRTPGPRAARVPVPGHLLDRARCPEPRPADLMTGAVAAHHAAEITVRTSPGVGAPPTVAAPDEASEAQGARLPDGCVAVVGSRGARLAAARALLVAQVASGAEVEAVVPDDLAPCWSWLRWLPGSRRSPSGPLPRETEADRPRRGVRVLVVDAPAEDGPPAAWLSETLEDWWARRAGTDRLILVTADRRSVPAWCRTVLDTTHQRWHLVDGTVEPAPGIGVGDAWAERYVRHVAAAARLGRWPAGAAAGTTTDRADPTHPGLAEAVSLAGLLGVPVPPARASLAEWVGARWAASGEAPRPGLVVPLGTDALGGTVHVDLVRDGPHALVAGTTGAGKSELLQSLVLGLALTTGPRDLTVVLVDFKGGAGFGRCVDLPHVVGQVTDLEPGLAGRALAGLRAELRRREHVVAQAGARAVEDLPAGVLPRLVVVIDEFRALADDLPDFLPGLLRLAAQGRSLGVHLVLATQRPAGAVTADMRANISLRLALRQIDPGDSRDVIDAPHAARIPASRPGRVVLRCGNEPPLAVQGAHAAAPAPARTTRVRAAGRWGSDGVPTPGPVDDPTDLVALLVDAAVSAASRASLPAHEAPWLPALPGRVTPSDLTGCALPGEASPDDLPLALSDLPDEQRRGTVVWRPGDGHLAVVGRPRSGRSTTLRALAVAGLDRGWDVHVVAEAPTLTDGLREHPRCGTLVPRHDPRRVARLVDLLLRREGGPRTLVLLDDVEDLRSSLARLAQGAGDGALARLLGEGPARGVHVALAGGSPGLGGLAQRVGPRLVLSSDAVPDDVAHGVPSRLAGRGGRPGRAVWLGSGGPVECQVVVDTFPADGTWEAAGQGAVAGRGRPVRLLPLPRYVAGTPDDPDGAGTPAAQGDRGDRAGRVVVGRGGDGAGPVHLDIARGALVVGPSGSGRSSALLLLADHAHATGTLRAVLSRDERFEDLAHREVVGTSVAPAGGIAGRRPVAAVGLLTPNEVRAALQALQHAGLAAGDVVVVDDLDLMVQAFPVEAEILTEMARAGVVLLASASTTAAAMAHRGPVAEVRGRQSGLVLAPEERGSGDVFGRPLVRVVDPEGGPPGRAVAVRGGELVPVQVTAPAAARRTAAGQTGPLTGSGAP